MSLHYIIYININIKYEFKDLILYSYNIMNRNILYQLLDRDYPIILDDEIFLLQEEYISPDKQILNKNQLKTKLQNKKKIIPKYKDISPREFMKFHWGWII